MAQPASVLYKVARTTFVLKVSTRPACRDGTAKLGDVGMARIMANDYITGVVGTLAW